MIERMKNQGQFRLFSGFSSVNKRSVALPACIFLIGILMPVAFVQALPVQGLYQQEIAVANQSDQ